MRRGLDILVGTPGRIFDHVQRGKLDLTQLQYVDKSCSTCTSINFSGICCIHVLILVGYILCMISIYLIIILQVCYFR